MPSPAAPLDASFVPAHGPRVAGPARARWAPSRKERLRRAILYALAATAAVLVSHGALAAGDPYLDWWTLETPHFHVHYYRGLEPLAERIARIAEGVYPQMTEALGWTPSEATEIVLTDDTDDANGSATPLPYNTIRLFASAPDDISPLGDYGDRDLELVTHEFTHILHMDNITGAPALVNAILGKTLSPNSMQPRWLLEGLAVLEESRHTSGGRNRSSVFDMYMRADVIEGRLATLPEVSNVTRRWPQGNLWYLYGSRFLTWIADVYGDSTMRAIAADYGHQLIPFGINRSIRRATGRTYIELYEGWKAYLRDLYGAQIARVEARGLREGRRLTHHGQVAAYPRFVPDAGQGAPAELLYFRDDGNTRSGFYRFAMPAGARDADPDEHLVVRTAGDTQSASFDPNGGLVFSSAEISNHIYAYDDLFALPAGAESPSGFEGTRRRLSVGARAKDPAVSPDGRWVVYTQNHRSTTTLLIARLKNGQIVDPRPLVPSALLEQAYTPRFSPDGRRVVYSAWTRGGYRDIRIVDVATGTFREIFHDRALDWEPTFSPDGRTVFFASDRAYAIPNIFAADLDTGKVWQVTNVRTGAFQPEISPDGKTLVYVGYTSYGFDLFAMPIDRSRWLEPPPCDDSRPDPPPRAQATILSRHPYNPFPTLRPRSWDFAYGPGSFGTAFRVSTVGFDVVGHHSISASLLIDGDAGPQASIGYSYGRLPFDFGVSAYRLLTPRRGFRYNDEQPLLTEEQLGVTSGVSYGWSSAVESQAISFSYSIARTEITLPTTPHVDPQSLVPIRPPRGQLGTVHFGWSYSNAESYLFGVGAERGISASVGVDMAEQALASDFTLYAFSYGLATYWPMPWLRHNVLALRAAGAVAGGDYPNRGLYYTGGFVERPLINPRTTDPNGLLVGQGSFVLRGYPPLAFSGSQYHLFNAEYRFPLLTLDRGLSTLPLYLQRVDGNFFADYGGAFETLDTHDPLSQFHLGVGAELWAELLVAYGVGVNVRLGYATGLGDPASIPGGQFYLVLAAPF